MLARENILKQLSACKIAAGKYQEAEELLKNNMNGDRGDLQYYLGLTYAAQGKSFEAIQELMSSLKSNPSHALARHLAFRLLLNQARQKIEERDMNSLSSILGMAAELAPNTPAAMKEISYFKDVLPISHIKAGKREEAAKIWEEELKKHPSNTKLIHNLALLYYWWALDEEAKVADASTTDDKFNLSRLWTKSIAYWVTLLSMSQFWAEWKEEKQSTWHLEIKAEDLEAFRESFLEERFVKIFNNYVDLYKQNGKKYDSSRHEEYLKIVLLEKESARCWKDSLDYLDLWARTHGIQIDEGVKRYELIRTIQKAEGNEPCFGTAKDCAKNSNECQWSSSCKSDRNRELFLNISAGYRFFCELEMLPEADKVMALLHREYPANESIGRLRLYFHPLGLGKVLILLEQRQKPQMAIDMLNSLLIDHISYKNSIEFQYVYALALTERGKLLLREGAVNKALDDFAAASKHVYDPIKSIADNPLYRNFIISLNADIHNAVVKSCEKEAIKLKQSDKIDDAIAILQKGISIVSDADNKALRDHLVIFYCDMGDNKLSAKKYAEARKYFEEALKYDGNYKRAKELIGMTYNNEGVDKSSPDQSIPLFEKALQYEPDAKVVKENLAGAYNGRAVNLLNSLSQHTSRYSNMDKCNEAVNLLKKATKLLNPSLEDAVIEALLFAGDRIDGLIKDVPESIYKTVIRNLAIAGKYQSVLRGY